MEKIKSKGSSFDNLGKTSIVILIIGSLISIITFPILLGGIEDMFSDPQHIPYLSIEAILTIVSVTLAFSILTLISIILGVITTENNGWWYVAAITSILSIGIIGGILLIVSLKHREAIKTNTENNS